MSYVDGLSFTIMPTVPFVYLPEITATYCLFNIIKFLALARDDGMLGEVSIRVVAGGGGGQQDHVTTGLLYKLTGQECGQTGLPQGPLKVII
jgi:hypothetical protein